MLNSRSEKYFILFHLESVDKSYFAQTVKYRLQIRAQRPSLKNGLFEKICLALTLCRVIKNVSIQVNYRAESRAARGEGMTLYTRVGEKCREQWLGSLKVRIIECAQLTGSRMSNGESAAAARLGSIDARDD